VKVKFVWPLAGVTVTVPVPFPLIDPPEAVAVIVSPLEAVKVITSEPLNVAELGNMNVKAEVVVWTATEDVPPLMTPNKSGLKLAANAVHAELCVNVKFADTPLFAPM
jgi:hypothetical protein